MLFHGNQQTSVTATSMCNATGGVFVCADTRGLLVPHVCLHLASIQENIQYHPSKIVYILIDAVFYHASHGKGIFPRSSPRE